MEKFLGKWKSDGPMENFDEYMKTIEVNLILRKAASVSTTTITIGQDGDYYTWHYKIAFKSGDLKFKLGEEFDQVTPDDRPVKTTFTLEGDAFIQTQLGKPCDVVMERRLENDGNLMVELCKAKDVVCKRQYKRVKE